MIDVKKLLEEIGIPGRDLYELPDSKKRFPDGAQWRIEISGVERVSVLKELIDESRKRDVPVHRLISVVMGATLLTKDELKSFAELASEAEMEVILTPGPRQIWDTGRQISTPEGALSGLRHRGADQLNYVLQDIFRAIEIGFRGFLVTDEGLLWVLNMLRKKKYIPSNTKFKVSIFAGHANPAGAKVLENLGADTFNPIGDLSLPALAAIRRATDIPLDLHIYLFDSFGGFVRFYEAPDMIRVTSPCYFKIEPGVSVSALYKPWVSSELLGNMAREKVKYAEIIMEIVDRNYPEAKLSNRGARDLAIPEP